MADQMEVKRLFYDTETTGTDYRKHSVLEISFLLDIAGELVDRRTYKIRPHPKAQIEAAALKVNGHDDLEIWAYPEAKDVLNDMKEWFGKYVNKYDSADKMHLCGYNNRGFDDNFFRMMFKLEGDAFFGSWFWSDSIDVLCLASERLAPVRHKMVNFKLKRVCQQMGLDVDDDAFHGAEYDAIMTRRLYYALKDDLF